MKNILLICSMILSLGLNAQNITNGWATVDSTFTATCSTAYFSTDKSVVPTEKTSFKICVYQDLITYVTVTDLLTDEMNQKSEITLKESDFIPSALEQNSNIEYRLYWDRPYDTNYWSRSVEFPATVEKGNDYLYFPGPDSIKSVNVIILERTFIEEDSTDCLFLFVGGIDQETSPLGSNMFHTIDLKKSGIYLEELDITDSNQLVAYITNEETSVKYESTNLEIKDDGNISVTFNRKAFESSHRIHLTDNTGLHMSYLIN